MIEEPSFITSLFIEHFGPFHLGKCNRFYIVDLLWGFHISLIYLYRVLSLEILAFSVSTKVPNKDFFPRSFSLSPQAFVWRCDKPLGCPDSGRQ